MALSRAEELLFSHLSILVILFAPFTALESLFMAMFPIDPPTPFRVFPRAGEYPDCPAGVPHLLALLAKSCDCHSFAVRDVLQRGGGRAFLGAGQANDGVLEDAGGRDDDVR
ncbi:hypothetical protein MY8738_003370 [Beauveria namnaoensis]